MLSQIERVYSRIMVEFAPPAARIELMNPPLNLIDPPMLDELLAAIQQIGQRADISFLFLAGNEKTFCAGVEQPGPAVGKFHAVIHALASCPKITLAAVRGQCLGAGAELALVCDMIFCTEDSVWQFPEINHGGFPPVAAVLLPELVGRKRAAEMIFTGQVIHGDEAFHLGLANDAVPDAELDELLDEVGGRLAALSPTALAQAKQALGAWDVQQFEQRLQQAENISPGK